MGDWPALPLIRQCYRRAFDAVPAVGYDCWLQEGASDRHGAALGYRRADSTPLFLESYLDQPIETLASASLGREVPRTGIVEIGNFAAADGHAMIRLWAAAANDLGLASEIAAATLTAPMRAMFARIGVPIRVLGPARADRLGAAAARWGRYYKADPQVCIGEIGPGQQAIAAFMARRRHRPAA
ncbi:Thermostable hemolysin [Sphingomonas sp. YR710]|uniref:thermostable hemolysin n=1 Tax=Sphingomonas sp. YR710 TaxID=1882773 RepID=UPI0008837D5C|nr:thermostable hemolysin [Sphingomonas sp. YR710]SDC13139.1 Thermostable hemolysin [Sphingomonas sp. YR710]